MRAGDLDQRPGGQTRSLLLEPGREREEDLETPTLSLIDPIDEDDDLDPRETPHLRSVGGESA